MQVPATKVLATSFDLKEHLSNSKSESWARGKRLSVWLLGFGLFQAVRNGPFLACEEVLGV